jgi:hypothetical protein
MPFFSRSSFSKRSPSHAMRLRSVQAPGHAGAEGTRQSNDQAATIKKRKVSLIAAVLHNDSSRRCGAQLSQPGA